MSSTSCPGRLGSNAARGPKVLAKNSTGVPSTAYPNTGKPVGLSPDTVPMVPVGSSSGGLHLGRVVVPIAADVVNGGAGPADSVGHTSRGVERCARAGRHVVADELIAGGRVAHQPSDLLVAVPVGIRDAQCLRLDR